MSCWFQVTDLENDVESIQKAAKGVAGSFATKIERKRKLLVTLDKSSTTPTLTISESSDPPQHVAGQWQWQPPTGWMQGQWMPPPTFIMPQPGTTSYPRPWIQVPFGNVPQYLGSTSAPPKKKENVPSMKAENIVRAT